MIVADETVLLAILDSIEPLLTGGYAVEKVSITVELTEHEAMALAQFIKRVGWSDVRANAVDDRDCSLMMDALRRVQCSLAEEGFNPR